MPVLKSTSVLLATALLVACSTPPSRPSAADKSIEIEVVDTNNASTGIDAADGLHLATFPLIQGSLVGPVTTRPVFSLPVRFGYAAQLPLAELAARIAPLAQPATAQMLADGLTVSPPESRLARVGAFFVKDEADQSDVVAGFLEDLTRDTVFLVYFDRACKVSGTVRVGGIDIAVDVPVAREGMFWLRVRKDDARHWSLLPDDTQMPIALVTTGQP